MNVLQHLDPEMPYFLTGDALPSPLPKHHQCPPVLHLLPLYKSTQYHFKLAVLWYRQGAEGLS